MHSSAPRMSLPGRLPETQSSIEDDPTFLERLAPFASHAAHTLDAAKHLCIDHHPDIQLCRVGLESAGRSSDHLAAVRSVIYRLDTHAQYLDVTVLLPPPPDPPRRVRPIPEVLAEPMPLVAVVHRPGSSALFNSTHTEAMSRT